MPDDTKHDARIYAPEFRNGWTTAISVIVGFSLSFLSRSGRHAGQMARARTCSRSP